MAMGFVEEERRVVGTWKSRVSEVDERACTAEKWQQTEKDRVGSSERHSR